MAIAAVRTCVCNASARSDKHAIQSLLPPTPCLLRRPTEVRYFPVAHLYGPKIRPMRTPFARGPEAVATSYPQPISWERSPRTCDTGTPADLRERMMPIDAFSDDGVPDNCFLPISGLTERHVMRKPLMVPGDSGEERARKKVNGVARMPSKQEQLQHRRLKYCDLSAWRPSIYSLGPCNVLAA